MKLPEKIKRWRASRGFSQAAAAVALGVPVRTLQNYESGHRSPRGLALEALLSKLKNLKPL